MQLSDFFVLLYKQKACFRPKVWGLAPHRYIYRYYINDKLSGSIVTGFIKLFLFHLYFSSVRVYSLLFEHLKLLPSAWIDRHHESCVFVGFLHCSDSSNILTVWQTDDDGDLGFQVFTNIMMSAFSLCIDCQDNVFVCFEFPVRIYLVYCGLIIG